MNRSGKNRTIALAVLLTSLLLSSGAFSASGACRRSMARIVSGFSIVHPIAVGKVIAGRRLSNTQNDLLAKIRQGKKKGVDDINFEVVDVVNIEAERFLLFDIDGRYYLLEAGHSPESGFTRFRVIDENGIEVRLSERQYDSFKGKAMARYGDGGDLALTPLGPHAKKKADAIIEANISYRAEVEKVWDTALAPFMVLSTPYTLGAKALHRFFDRHNPFRQDRTLSQSFLHLLERSGAAAALYFVLMGTENHPADWIETALEGYDEELGEQLTKEERREITLDEYLARTDGVFGSAPEDKTIVLNGFPAYQSIHSVTKEVMIKRYGEVQEEAETAAFDLTKSMELIKALALGLKPSPADVQKLGDGNTVYSLVEGVDDLFEKIEQAKAVLGPGNKMEIFVHGSREGDISTLQIGNDLITNKPEDLIELLAAKKAALERQLSEAESGSLPHEVMGFIEKKLEHLVFAELDKRLKGLPESKRAERKEFIKKQAIEMFELMYVQDLSSKIKGIDEAQVVSADELPQMRGALTEGAKVRFISCLAGSRECGEDLVSSVVRRLTTKDALAITSTASVNFAENHSEKDQKVFERQEEVTEQYFKWFEEGGIKHIRTAISSEGNEIDPRTLTQQFVDELRRHALVPTDTAIGTYLYFTAPPVTEEDTVKVFKVPAR